ncbi:MAG: flagellar M-ring protein FliF C-terminal domain-containing protein [Planctomycetota bacterium]|nr:flagellar M-ring protein FliF C-terminal domain-containing protein [Planctomycetota bacterium]
MDFLTNLKSQFATASAGAKVALAVGAAVLVGAIYFANTWAATPSFKLLYSELDSRSAAAVQSALASANVRFQVSQPPGPFTVHVDETQFYVAQNAVAIAGALSTAPEGIQTNGNGASQVFLSAPERAQNALKREWQELEKQLEELDFVQRAHVSTSSAESSPMKKSVPMTVAVTLTLRGRGDLSRGQASTVAKIARFRFNVPQENVLIADQSGRSLFDGSVDGDQNAGKTEVFDHARRYDEELAGKTNQVLDRVFGPGMAYVVVNSKWQFGELESVKETIDPKAVTINETKNETSTPNSSQSPAVGTSANLTAEFGATNAAIPAVTNASAPVAQPATTKETTTSKVVGRETRLERSSAPKLERLSVSLFLDESQRERLKDLESSVKASVGFDDKRDGFSSLVTAFAAFKRDDKGQIVSPPAPAEVSAPNRMTEMLIQRGIEIGAAVAFLFLLFKTLKSSPKSATASKTDASVGGEMDERSLELLAKTEIEELVKSDPQRVSTILSRWAAEEETVGAGR